MNYGEGGEMFDSEDQTRNLDPDFGEGDTETEEDARFAAKIEQQDKDDQ